MTAATETREERVDKHVTLTALETVISNVVLGRVEGFESLVLADEIVLAHQQYGEKAESHADLFSELWPDPADPDTATQGRVVTLAARVLLDLARRPDALLEEASRLLAQVKPSRQEVDGDA